MAELAYLESTLPDGPDVEAIDKLTVAVIQNEFKSRA
jgi:hypothetical protein